LAAPSLNAIGTTACRGHVGKFGLARLKPSDHALATRAALGTEPGATLCLAGLFIEFADPNLFLDPTALYQFAEPPHGLLRCLFIPQR
jgi:hypothetical protein